MIRQSAVIKSLVFHALVVGSLVVSVPFLSRDLASEQPILTVEIVTTVPETNLDEGSDVEPKISEVESPEEQVEETPPAPPPPSESAPPEEEAEAVPTETAEPAPEQELKTAEPPKPVTAPPKRPTQQSPAVKTREETQALLTSKLQDLTERKITPKRELTEKEQKKQDAENKIDQLVGQALNTPKRDSSKLGVSEKDLLRHHIHQCWNPPPGASGADALIVDIIVRLNKRAEVMEVKIVESVRMANSTFKAAALAAQRAVVECSPLPLPLEKYELWKELEFEFNPAFITRS